MYRLATKRIAKKRSEKRHTCLWTPATCNHRCRKRTAHLSTMTHRAVKRAALQQRCADCGRVRLRTQIRSNCWIRGLTANRFFVQRSRCCDHNE